MAGTVIAGKGGSVVIPGTPNAVIAKLTDWSISLQAADLDQTALGDDWEDSVPGIKSWTAKVNGYYVADQDTTGQMALQNALLNGTSPVMQFQLAQGRGYYEGTLNVTGIDVAESNKALATFAGTFKGRGPLNHLP